MSIITREMFEECYSNAILYHQGKISLMEARDNVAQSTNMNKNSAQRSIHSIAKMFDGEIYYSLLSKLGIEVVFSNIARDYGNKILVNAIIATLKNVDYIKRKRNVNLVGILDICSKYNNIYNLNINNL